jgi:hypothetical protein
LRHIARLQKLQMLNLKKELQELRCASSRVNRDKAIIARAVAAMELDGIAVQAQRQGPLRNDHRRQRDVCERWRR